MTLRVAKRRRPPSSPPRKGGGGAGARRRSDSDRLRKLAPETARPGGGCWPHLWVAFPDTPQAGPFEFELGLSYPAEQGVY